MKFDTIVRHVNRPYASCDGVGFSIWRQTFKMAAMTAFHRRTVLPPGVCTRNVCRALCSRVRQFLIYSTFVLVFKRIADPAREEICAFRTLLRRVVFLT